MKVILCIAIGLVLLGGGAWLWKATRNAPRLKPAPILPRAKYEVILRDYYRKDIESAKKQGKKEEVILGAGQAMPFPDLPLEELLRDYGLFRVKVIDKETTVTLGAPDIPSADFDTWYKVEIMETLRRQRKGSDKALDIELPGRLLPLLPSESLLDEQGGAITVDGVTLIEELSSEGVVYFPNEEYLIVGYLDYGGKLIMRGSGRASVFHVKNSRLRPYGQTWRRLVREMEEKYGNDLDRLRSSMH